jgi:tetrahydromethanopterin S-methyltransferase subunit G
MAGVGFVFGQNLKTKDSLDKHKLHVSESYLKKTEFERWEGRIIERFDKSEEKADERHGEIMQLLGKKVDK